MELVAKAQWHSESTSSPLWGRAASGRDMALLDLGNISRIQAVVAK